MFSKEFFEELYFNQNLTQKQIAAKINMSQSFVNSQFMKLGIKSKSGWSKKDVAFLEDNFGIKSVKTLAKCLNRTEDAVIIKAKRLGLGGINQSSELLTLRDIYRAVGADMKTVKIWIRKYGLIASKRTLSKEKAYWRISLNNFWKWAKEHQELIKWSRFEVNSLGKEPKWTVDARKSDLKRPKKEAYKWTKEEDKLLRMYWNANKEAKEIAQIMHRSKQGVLRRASRLELNRRIILLPFKLIEDEILINMKLQGYRDIDIAEELGRSYGSVKFRRTQLIKQGKLKWVYREKATKNPDQSVQSSICKFTIPLYHENGGTQVD
ncbi:hypothetical protein ACTFIN_01755 [Clostridium cagae]|uniref:hypothetical protein n=1 Tax=Clostridium cagae TaxID=2080751 RepID=UPI003F771F59